MPLLGSGYYAFGHLIFLGLINCIYKRVLTGQAQLIATLEEVEQCHL